MSINSLQAAFGWPFLFLEANMNEIVEELLKRLDEDQRMEWEERAAIMQYDGGLPRDHAECLALLCIIRSAALLPSYIEGTLARKGEHHD